MNNNLNNINDLLAELEDMLERSTSVFGMRVIDSNKAKDIVKEISLSLPKVLHDAQIVLESRDKIEAFSLKNAEEVENQARMNAHDIIKKATQKSEELIAQDYITSEAIGLSKMLVKNSKEISDEIKKGIDDYFQAVVMQLEQNINDTEVRLMELNEQLSEHRKFLKYNKTKLEEFTAAFDENVEACINKLEEKINAHISRNFEEYNE